MKKNEIPKIDIDSPDFKENLAFQLWSTQSSADYRNDRERPYNGQPHTSEGERGNMEVRGLTMRDINDCIVQGLLSASTNASIQNKTTELSDEMIGTEYEAKGDWRYNDVYEIGDIDPIAAIQNTGCFIEKMMGIYPNVEKLNCEEIKQIVS